MCTKTLLHESKKKIKTLLKKQEKISYRPRVRGNSDSQNNEKITIKNYYYKTNKKINKLKLII